MNWGKGIAIFLVLFIAFITSLAVILMKANADLVSEDYYKKEVAYGKEIDAEQNALNENLILKTDVSEGGVFLQILNTVETGQINVHLLRGNDPNQDIIVSTPGPSTFIPKEKLSKGKYLLTVSWNKDNKDYQLKKEIWVE
ncbi:MAG: FixH family protein [Brumimicrobium sp.]|nr:FixH family protein [Brumimicrobium sp.]